MARWTFSASLTWLGILPEELTLLDFDIPRLPWSYAGHGSNYIDLVYQQAAAGATEYQVLAPPSGLTFDNGALEIPSQGDML